MQGQPFSHDFLRFGICAAPPWQALGDAQTEQLQIEPVRALLGWHQHTLAQAEHAHNRRDHHPSAVQAT